MTSLIDLFVDARFTLKKGFRSRSLVVFSMVLAPFMAVPVRADTPVEPHVETRDEQLLRTTHVLAQNSRTTRLIGGTVLTGVGAVGFLAFGASEQVLSSSISTGAYLFFGAVTAAGIFVIVVPNRIETADRMLRSLPADTAEQSATRKLRLETEFAEVAKEARHDRHVSAAVFGAAGVMAMVIGRSNPNSKQSTFIFYEGVALAGVGLLRGFVESPAERVWLEYSKGVPAQAGHFDAGVFALTDGVGISARYLF